MFISGYYVDGYWVTDYFPIESSEPISGIMRVTFTAAAPTITFTAAQPSITFTAE